MSAAGFARYCQDGLRILSVVSGGLLLLGLDAAEPELIRRWAADGKLPCIRKVLEAGTTGPLTGVEGFHVGSTWPSFYTGLSPAGHGFHRIEQLASGTYDLFRPLDSPTGLGGVPFWRLASDAGKRVAVLDVPLTRVEPGLNGIHVVEWGGHDSVFGFRTAPPSFAGDVLATVGPYPLPAHCDVERRTVDDFEQFVSGLERAVERKTALTLELLAREEWDLAIQVFSEAHCVGHQCWHLHDPTHPSHDRRLRDALSDPVERVYRAIDAGVGAILERASASRVLLFSSHGMRGFHGADFLLPEILYRLGATSAPPGFRARAARSARRRLTGSRVHGVARRIHRRLTGHRPPPTNVSHWADVATSRCFPVPNGSPVSAIRLNLIDREPRGVLRAGPEADAFCEELTRDLEAVVDERTGSPLVVAVKRTDSMYTGPRGQSLPDLLVEWSDDLVGTTAHGDGRGSSVRAYSEKIGVVEKHNSTLRTGDHLPDGLYAFLAPGNQTGSIGPPARLIDLHPSICRLLGVQAGDVDGEVIPGIAA
jgi:predicted AlkP superfamily phosphohydrolase/phosphomutase